jgi:pyruvate,water dikinase
MPMKYVVNLKDVNKSHLNIVGGKNASSGEMIQHLSSKGIRVPLGFATTVDAYRKFLMQNGLDKKIYRTLEKLNTSNLKALTLASKQIRRLILDTPFFPELETDILSAYSKMKNQVVAVRSSATTEDLATASFAGAQDTYLNIKGKAALLRAIKLVFASLFTSRAIAYRHDQGFDFSSLALSVGVQPMVRSDKGASGVMFTLDTESGFDQVILITAAYGLGEAIVQGQVNPDEFVVYKPLVGKHKFSVLQRRLGEKAVKLIYSNSNNATESTKLVSVNEKERAQFCIADEDIQILARQALIIEKHYGQHMDIEWAKDGVTGEIVILQARPETVKSRMKNNQGIERHSLSKKGNVLTQGQSIGQRIGAGVARVISNPNQIDVIKPGDILVTDMTDPDWEPIMKKAAAIITNRGGRTCHAAIVARELGIPAIVGCIDATKKIKDKQFVTVSCAEGDIGYVYEGKIPFKINKTSIDAFPKLPLDICINIGNPEKAFTARVLPNNGVGLARLEFIISGIGIHPNALLQFDQLPRQLQRQLQIKTAAYSSPVEYYVEKLREGISTISAAFFPKQVIFRFSDFKSNEYANLLGGHLFEPLEENPMIGFRGASRYKHERFRDCFELECKAFKRVRDDMKLTNAQLMIPFVRTVDELQQVIQLIGSYGLKRGKNDLKIFMMCEVPSNVVLADKFLPHVDGFSIGSNDLTQLMLGLDRDSNIVASLFDERNAAIKYMLKHTIDECNKKRKYIGICGQAPSDHPEFAEWLMHEGIQCMSLSSDTVIDTWMRLAKIKK